jgi:hypothetical protein
MQDLEKRVTQAEYVIGAHSEQLEDLQEAFKDLRSTLGGIEKLLAQIKWIAVGALLAVALSDGTIGAKLWKVLS